MSEQEQQATELKRYLGDTPIELTRRNLFGVFGGAVAALALGHGVQAGPARSHAELRRLAQETGPTAKIVIVDGQDLDELDPHYFKGIPSYYAVANLYDMVFGYDYTTQEDGGLFPKQEADGGWTLLPWLLESSQVSEDGLTLTFKLKQGLK